MDFCGRFVDAALSIQQGKGVKYGGDERIASLAAVNGVDPFKATFKQVLHYSHHGGIRFGMG